MTQTTFQRNTRCQVVTEGTVCKGPFRLYVELHVHERVTLVTNAHSTVQK